MAAKPAQDTVTVLAFRDRLVSLARENHVAFMVEGEPFAGILEKATMPPAASPSDSTDKVVAHFADAFDYNSRRRGNVYILRKRYSNPDEMPIVTPDECYATGSEWSKLINTFRQVNNLVAADPDDSDAIDESTQAAMVAALTPQQMADCQQGHYVMMRNLAPDARLRQMVLRAVMTECVGVNAKLPEVMNDRFTPGLLWFARNPVGKVGTTFPYPQGGVIKRLFDPLFTSSLPDTPENDTMARHLDTYPEIAVSLRRAVATLNASLAARLTTKLTAATKSTPEARSLAVEDAIASKSVLLVGVEDVTESPMALAVDLAQVYGLNTRRTPEKPTVVCLIRQPLPTRTDNLLDLWQVTRIALCAPLRTALHLDIEDTLEALPTIYHPKTLEDYNFLEKQNKARDAIGQQRNRFAEAAERELIYYLEHHLRKTVSAAGKANPTQQSDQSDLPETIPLNKLPLYYQSAYIIYTMRDSIVDSTANCMSPLYPPVQATHLDDSTLDVKMTRDEEGQRDIRLYFGLAPAENLSNAQSGWGWSVGYRPDPPPLKNRRP